MDPSSLSSDSSADPQIIRIDYTTPFIPVSGGSLAIANFIKEYNGDTPVNQWIQDTLPLLDQLPTTLKKSILLSKLVGRARTRIESISDSATSSDILRQLQQSSIRKELKLPDLLRLTQKIGQSVVAYANEVQDTASMINGSGHVVTSEMLSAIFVQGLTPAIKSSVEIIANTTDFKETVKCALKVENSQNSHTTLVLKRSYSEISNSVTNNNDTNCSKCGRTNHTTIQCKKDKQCFRCGKLGHFAKQCFSNKKSRSNEDSDNRRVNVMTNWNRRGPSA